MQLTEVYKMSKSKANRYDEDFQRSAVDLLIRSRRTVAEVARELGISGTTLTKWRQKCIDEPGPQRSSLQAENEKMRQEILELKQERDILKKSVAIFLKPQR